MTIVLDRHEDQVTLVDKAVPSYLRGFSAPVMLKDTSTADRLTLLAGDSDAFGRWDAGQALMLDTVRAMASDAAERDSLIESLGAGLAAMLADDRLDGAEKARILKLPSQSIMEGMMEVPDPLVIFDIRQKMLHDIGIHLLR